MQEDIFIDKIFVDNCLDAKSASIVFVTQINFISAYIVLDVIPRLIGIILKPGYLHFVCRRYNVEEYFHLIRCYKCC